ncbi:DNA polymerase ligase N-terminal domain-containing protein, partial [Pseudonocardia sp.]|uniref:DNA polymerase ligase N-terminal domain-containing protein n=1 Tax=Pseudonocardia sp. TaxID=60912 RepID=UPI00260DC9B9
MGDEPSAYQRKRSASRTPEPMPAEGPVPRGRDDLFVVHEHHAWRLHWDPLLERGGVLASWALPEGLPTDPRTITSRYRPRTTRSTTPRSTGRSRPGEYGAGRVEIRDHGTYDCEKWTDREIKVGEYRRRPRTDGGGRPR